MRIMTEGHHAISEMDAICYEDVSNEVTEEFKRKTRISTGNFQNLSVFWRVLFRLDALAFCFFSHKVIRWMGGFLLLTMLLSSGLLAVTNMWYGCLFLGLMLLAISPWIDRMFKSLNIHWSLLRFASYFTLMNIALIYGCYKYFQGVQTSAWSPTKRNL